MSSPSCFVVEEVIVDYVTEQLDGVQRIELELHLRDCAHCRQKQQEWAALFGHKSQQPQHSDSSRLIVHTPVQAQSLKAKLKSRVYAIAIQKRIRASFRWAFPMLATAVVVVIMIGLFTSQDPFSHPDFEMPVMGEDAKQFSLLHSPETIRYEAKALSPFQVSGIAYVKKSSQEMLIMVEGFVRTDSQDYQVWLVDQQSSRNAGTMKHGARTSHLYVQGHAISNLDHVIISVEPKGGSLVPTGPGAIEVKLE